MGVPLIAHFRVALTVAGHVVFVSYGRRQPVLQRRLEREPAPLDRMLLDHGSLLHRQLTRLVQHLVRDPRLSDIVQEAGFSDDSDLVGKEPQAFRERHGENGDVDAVDGRVGVMRLDGDHPGAPMVQVG